MPTIRPTAEAYADPTRPTAEASGSSESWERGLAELAGANTYWLSTIQSDGRAHTVPLFAVLVDGLVYFSASATSRKARNLQRDPRCTLAASGGGLDLVLDGTAGPISAANQLTAVASAYAHKYGWQPEVRGEGLWAEGAPTAGEPPYLVHEIRPRTVFGFPTDEGSQPTRWRFAETRSP